MQSFGKKVESLNRKKIFTTVLVLGIAALVLNCNAVVSASAPLDGNLNAEDTLPNSGEWQSNSVSPEDPDGIDTEDVETVNGASMAKQDSSGSCALDLTQMLDEAYGNGDGSEEYQNDYAEEYDEIVLVTYRVSGDEISSPVYGKQVPLEFAKYVNDEEFHREIWQIVTDLIPVDRREDLDQFVLFTDGVDNVTGAVDEGSTPETWSIQMDVLDAENFPSLSTTLVHEFGHMLTLGESQVKYFASSCNYYMASDGCSKADSYINAFYDEFWSDIYDEWADYANPTVDGEVDEDGAYEFYDEHPDQFVSDYAATHPEEDIAESWTYFVYSSKPADDSIASRKIRFFYRYPELVELRQYMMNGLCQQTEK